MPPKEGTEAPDGKLWIVTACGIGGAPACGRQQSAESHREDFQGRSSAAPSLSDPTTWGAGTSYRNGLPDALEAQARTRAELTGWEKGAIREHMRETGQQF